MPGLPLITVDHEAVLRAWARSLDLNGATGRVFFAVPDDPAWPLVVLRPISAPPDPMLPVIYARVEWSIWGAPGRGREIASDIANILAAATKSVAWRHPGTGAFVDDGQVSSGPSPRPDVEAHQMRYTIDAVYAVRPGG